MNSNEVTAFLLHFCDFSDDVSHTNGATLDHPRIDPAQVELFAFLRVDEFQRVYAEAG